MCWMLLQDGCVQLRQLADEFKTGDALAAGLCWLADTMSVAINSTSSCLEVWSQHQAFNTSSSHTCLQQQQPKLEQEVHQLLSELEQLAASSKSRTATKEQVLRPALRVLAKCRIVQQQQQHEQWQLPGAEKDCLMWHIHVLTEAQLQPAALSCLALQRLSVQLLILCCRLARCHQPSGSAEVDDVSRRATAIARQLGLADAVAAMPYEAAQLQQPIKQLEQQLPYAAAAITNSSWLLLQCQQGAVAGPVALLQSCEMQLHATGRAFLPASYLGLRFVDCLMAVKESLFASAVPMPPKGCRAASYNAAAAMQQDQQSDATHIGAPAVEVNALLALQQSVAAQHLNSADAAALQHLLQSFMQLMQMDITVSPDTALAVSSGADELLDGFKSALSSCKEVLQQGRERLQPCCSRLSIRGELLQKEVLKAELALVGQAFTYQVGAVYCWL